MNANINAKNMVSPYLLFFLVHAAQTGVSVLSFQTHIIKGAGHDAWIPVLVFGLLMPIIFFMMLYILKGASSGDILSFHKDIFGKYIGSLLNIVLAIYFSLVSLTAIHTYIDILQIWVFDGIASWEFSLLFTIIIFYIISGGFRIVTAIAFWGVVIPSFLLLSLVYLLNFTEPSYLFPMFELVWKDFFTSAKEAAPLYFGMETALVFLPFVKNKKKASKWGYFALLYTTLLYTIITVITFMFFTQEKLEKLSWPTLMMIKIIRLPFLERFEFIFIFTWLLVVIPVACIYLWSAIRSIKLTFPQIKPTFVLGSLLVVFFYINSFLIDIKFSFLIGNVVNYSGLVVLFGYIPFLFIIAVIKNQFKKKDKNKEKGV
ncbi:GerAB/ArcD/ProY family transporter [Ornithinibacillus halotolerans]|uniref:Germination protein GerB n=1 Tax=Ornithinibacillus halotolerans TaxID=1274357 RepID=A0A916RPF2_9BACI|nr:GerAB/ArcD/ProY family transporter [Ornithinibacillus halotolerans]GGA64009.1 germination protein GerB [Ornithinibacillus halotolerans]